MPSKAVCDDAQDIVKAVSGDLTFKTEHHIGAVNSINWARIAAQVIYYFSAWLQATESEDEEVTFSVPSGNFGDVLAGWIAKQMGLPVARLIVATNETMSSMNSSAAAAIAFAILHIPL